MQPVRNTARKRDAQSVNPRSRGEHWDEVASAIPSARLALGGVASISGLVNILYLTGPFFMLEVYDRVLPSRSFPTLAALGLLVLVLYVFQGGLDFVRTRVLERVASGFDRRLSQRIYDIIVRQPLLTGRQGHGLEPLRQRDQVRVFLSSPGAAALFDLPWVPVYLAICFAFNSWIGLIASAGAFLLAIITLITEFLTRPQARAAAVFALKRAEFAEAGHRNAEALQAMGMTEHASRLWKELDFAHLSHQQRASDVIGGFSAMTKTLRLALQSAALGVGAYLVLQDAATAGVIIAGSILVSRALAPIELSIAHWKNFVAARQGWKRLVDLLEQSPPAPALLPLPRPSKTLALESASVAPPGAQKPVVQDVNFSLDAGSALAVVGPSASGKSSLARLIVGVWTPCRGKVRLDGATLDQWSAVELGRSIGYLPQDVELFAGTIAQNIARFDPDADAKGVLAAAVAAGADEMVRALPQGYQTRIGENGMALSAGQSQRVALARALYGDPFLVVLDEPNAHLDGEGEAALVRAITGVRARGGIVIVVAHRGRIMAAVDFILVMDTGRVRAFGQKDALIRAQKATATGSLTNPSADTHPRASDVQIVQRDRLANEHG